MGFQIHKMHICSRGPEGDVKTEGAAKSQGKGNSIRVLWHVTCLFDALICAGCNMTV